MTRFFYAEMITDRRGGDKTKNSVDAVQQQTDRRTFTTWEEEECVVTEHARVTLPDCKVLQNTTF